MTIPVGSYKSSGTLISGGVLAICVGLGSASAIAQAPADELEEITVTGSRIARANEVQPNPVYGMDSSDIKASGQLSVIDIVDTMPQLFSSQNSAQSNFFGTDTNTGLNNAPGVGTLDLRGLGANRTLVLVDGRRHVAGVAGSAGVDVQTIPVSLIERVEVLTGGASSIYGADAVTGVVNFIMKDNFQGTEFDVQGGVPTDGGGNDLQLSLTHGQSWINDRLNVTVNATVRRREETKMRDKSWAENSGIATSQNNNWRLVFQNGDTMPPGAFLGAAIADTDINGACTANFAGTDPALVARACAALPQSIERNMRFGLTSPQGLVAVALAEDITAATPERATSFPLFHTEADLPDLAPGTPVMDFNSNGIDDCTESFVGQAGYWIGGCTVLGSDGNMRPFNPGIIDGDINFDSINSDGSPQSGADHQSLDPKYEQIVVNALINFEMTENTRLFTDLKYVTSETTAIDGTISFEDTINISQENPFIPTQLQGFMNNVLALNPQFANTAQYFMSRDPEDIYNDGIYERETIRAVVGVEGDFWDSWTWEAALNYGQTTEDGKDRTLLPDRYFASLDSITDPASGNPVCRSEVDPNWTLDTYNSGSIFGAPGVNTFTPGDGSCAAGNPFGYGNFSPESQAFIAPYRLQNDEIKQSIASFIVTGDTSRWFELPGGAIGLATGLEYRKEESASIPDAFEQAGYYFNSQTSPVVGEYSVAEWFVEVSMPILQGVTLAEELTVDAAYRFSDYDLAVGKTNSYSAGISWAPIEDLRFRGTYARAVRAPNIFELFSPQTGTTFNLDIDPCDASAINSLAVSDPATAAQRAANCAADPLVGPGFQNPLTSNFPGVTGGNPDLSEETSDTVTAGLVFTPSIWEGFSFTFDYWSIEIEDAVQVVAGEDILRGCYDGPNLDPTFCSLFTRIADTNSGFFGGLNFMQTGQVNFASLNTSGVDMEILYNFEAFGGGITLRANATRLDAFDEFRSVIFPDLADDEKGEMQKPEWAGNIGARWDNENWSLDYTGRYMGTQLHRTIEANEAASFDNARTGILWMHNLSASYTFSDRYRLYGGIHNITNEQPFATQPNFPTGLRGRYVSLGFTATLGR